MKNLLFISLTLMVFLLSSCKKDEDFTDPDKLSGTSWKSGNMGTVTEPDYYMLKFTSKTTVELWSKYSGDNIFSKEDSGIFTISGTRITFNFEYVGSIEGTIDGTTITIVDGGETGTFIKQ